jgi:hypothetical protein
MLANGRRSPEIFAGIVNIGINLIDFKAGRIYEQGKLQ